MTDHTFKQFDTDIDAMRSAFTTMGGLVERQVIRAIDAVRDEIRLGHSFVLYHACARWRATFMAVVRNVDQQGYAARAAAVCARAFADGRDCPPNSTARQSTAKHGTA